MTFNEKYQTIAFICLGASIGSTARFLIYDWVGKTFTDTYLATATVNILGSFFIGILFVVFSAVHSPNLQFLLMTGLLASFTTFSTLSLDAVKLFTNGQIELAFLYVGGQIILGIGFCFLGVKIGQKLI